MLKIYELKKQHYCSVAFFCPLLRATVLLILHYDNATQDKTVA